MLFHLTLVIRSQRNLKERRLLFGCLSLLVNLILPDVHPCIFDGGTGFLVMMNEVVDARCSVATLLAGIGSFVRHQRSRSKGWRLMPDMD